MGRISSVTVWTCAVEEGTMSFCFWNGSQEHSALNSPLSILLAGWDVESAPLSHSFVFLQACSQRIRIFLERLCRPVRTDFSWFHAVLSPLWLPLCSSFFLAPLCVHILNAGIYLSRVLASAISSPLPTHTLSVNAFRTILHPCVHGFHGYISP